jgi:hypothetical protein
VIRVPAEAGNFSSHHRVQTDSGVHPTGTRRSFPGGKAALCGDAVTISFSNKVSPRTFQTTLVVAPPS